MLAYLDAELPKTQTVTATEHLHSCWTCRIEMERLESDIAIILDAHNESFVQAIPPPPSTWPSFDALLARRLPEVPQPIWMRINDALRTALVPARTVILAGLIADIVLFSLFKFESRPVSAKEVLRSVQAPGSECMTIPPGRAIRERMHVRRKVRGQDVGSGSVNVWKSPTAAVWQDSDSDSGVAALK
jgi:anti-sigma factor RsiW